MNSYNLYAIKSFKHRTDRQIYTYFKTYIEREIGWLKQYKYIINISLYHARTLDSSKRHRDRRADCYQYENTHTLLYVLYEINLLNISLNHI